VIAMPRTLTDIAAVIAVIALGACGGPAPAQNAAPVAAGRAYGYEQLRFGPATEGRSVVSAGDLTLTISEPDNAAAPSAWEGPLEIRDAQGRSCAAEPSLIQQVFLDTPRTTVLIVSYSGSMTYLDFVDPQTCRAKWPRVDVVTGGIEVTGDRIILQPACEGEKGRVPCHAGRVFQTHAAEPPAQLDADSRALTRQVLGVEFAGRQWVENPRSQTARIVP
jgi:hypothetical protein